MLRDLPFGAIVGIAAIARAEADDVALLLDKDFALPGSGASLPSFKGAKQQEKQAAGYLREIYTRGPDREDVGTDGTGEEEENEEEKRDAVLTNRLILLSSFHERTEAATAIQVPTMVVVDMRLMLDFSVDDQHSQTCCRWSKVIICLGQLACHLIQVGV